MAKFDCLITCAGWEDRFIGGLKNSIETHDVSKVIVIVVAEFKEKTEKKIAELKGLVNKVELLEIECSLLDDLQLWKTIESSFENRTINGESLCVDITTMPRFIIWFFMHFLDHYGKSVEYIYFQPERYEQCDWLTSDAEEPRLVFKHSGICLPDRSTILIIQTGFDIERVNQLIYTYEPERVFLYSQVGEQFNNAIENLNKHKEHLKYQDIEYVEIDAFGGDFGFGVINDVIVRYKDECNIIVSSFGPKPTSLAMYKLNKVHPEIGLSYVLVKNYNDQYSHGVDVENVISVNSASL